jgi:hypothetical protein
MPVYKNNKTDKILYGIFDFNKSSALLGDFLGLLEELLIISIKKKYSRIEICFIGNSFRLLHATELKSPNKEWLYISGCNSNLKSWIGQLSISLLKFDSYYVFPNNQTLSKFLKINRANNDTWPTQEKLKTEEKNYGYSTLAKKQFKEKGSIPYLEFKADIIRSALDFIDNYITPHRLVTVHLKNSTRMSGKADWYNADFDAWISFFKKSLSSFDVKFLLIGDEVIPEEIHKLPNVLISQKFSNSLTLDLALIQTSYAFMGSASGPSTIAKYSATPYLIYKNPNHHVNEMKKDLGSTDNYNFARSFQRLIRKLEDQSLIFSDFENLYTNIQNSEWETRLKKLKESCIYIPKED